MHEDLLENLTQPQTQAVLHHTGPCLVVAGAGTGKTKVITQRIAYLILERQVPQETIVALTFTDKAAREMEERVDLLLPYGTTGATISTFHSYCADILKRHAFLAGIDPAARLLTGADEVALLRRNIDKLPVSLYKPARNPVDFLRALVQFIGRSKDELLEPQAIALHAKELLAAATDESESEKAALLGELAAAYAATNEIYAEAGALSYADLMYRALLVLREHPSALAAEQERAAFLLIDEFQDTNTVQNELARLLGGKTRNVMAVGDDDQAIYSFRGANLENILSFRKTYPEAAVVALTDNFRSSQPILDAAYRLVCHNNPERLDAREGISKRLISHKEESVPPIHLHYEREAFEQRGVITEIARLIEEEGIPAEEIAILSRSRNGLRSFENGLRGEGLPFQSSADSRLYAQAPIQIALAYLRFLTDPTNDLNLFHLLIGQPFGADEEALRPLVSEARYLSETLWGHLSKKPAEELPETLAESITYLQAARGKAAGQAPSLLIAEFLHSSGWHRKLANEDQDGRTLELLGTFYEEITAYERLHRPASTEHYVQHIDYLLASEEDISTAQGAELERYGVQLMTIHKSKGLEFRAVFVVGMVHGRFPSRNMADALPFPYALASSDAPDSAANLREERRLAYVALTRAKERLYLVSCEQYEERKTKAKPSQFIAEALEAASTEPIRLEHEALLAPPPAAPEPTRAPLKVPTSFSASALETYEQCPKRYEYQYVLNVRIPNSALSNFGTSVHATLQHWFLARQQGSMPDLAELYRSCWIPGGYETKAIEERQYAEGYAKLKEYLDSVGPDTVPLFLETACRAKLTDGTEIRGKIDRIDRRKDGSLAVIDYKTGARPKSAKDLAADLPLGAYVLSLEQQGKKVGSVELQYVMAGEQVRLERDQLDTAGITAKAEGIVTAIGQSMASGTFVATPAKLTCQFCDYQAICPFRYGSPQS
jgi:DNA helicase-2/ATP-dependent DNA helicase PcrA